MCLPVNSNSESWLNQQTQYDLWQAEQYRKELDVSHLYVA
jgi:plasmid maintenance system antidote protein VapI